MAFLRRNFDMKFLLKKLLRIFLWASLIFIISSVSLVVLYKWVNPPITPLMIKRKFEDRKDDKSLKIVQKWVDIEEINGSMSMAVIASEDNHFLSHYGVDWRAIQRAREANKTRKRKLGASTITQQTAKNVFLWPSRTYTRKAFELYFAGLIELIWGKERIMEVYLNVIEMGNGIFGIEAASGYYFHKHASQLSPVQASTIAAILPNPRKYSAKNPSKFILSRRSQIVNLSGKLTRPEWAKRKKKAEVKSEK